MDDKEKGWIKLYRGIQDHWIWQDEKFSRAQAWLDLVLMANHKSIKMLFLGKLIEIERGQFITSEAKLSKRWNWSREKIRNFLKLLESEKMITKISTRSHTSITIDNYSLYQDSDTTKKLPTDYQPTPEQQQTDNQTATDQQQTNNQPTTDRQQTDNRPDTNKNDKNDKNDKNNINNIYIIKNSENMGKVFPAETVYGAPERSESTGNEDYKPNVNNNFPAETVHGTPERSESTGNEDYLQDMSEIFPAETVDRTPERSNKTGNEDHSQVINENFPAETVKKVKSKTPERSSKTGNEDFSPEFLEFWRYYPRKVEMFAAYKCFNTILKKGETLENLIKSAKNYAIYCSTDNVEEKYMKHASTFLGTKKSYLEFLKDKYDHDMEDDKGGTDRNDNDTNVPKFKSRADEYREQGMLRIPKETDPDFWDIPF